MAREAVPLNVIQRQLGNRYLGVTSVYLPGIDNAEIINAVYAPQSAHDARERRPAALTRVCVGKPKPEHYPRAARRADRSGPEHQPPV